MSELRTAIEVLQSDLAAAQKTIAEKEQRIKELDDALTVGGKAWKATADLQESKITQLEQRVKELEAIKKRDQQEYDVLYAANQANLKESANRVEQLQTTNAVLEAKLKRAEKEYFSIAEVLHLGFPSRSDIVKQMYQRELAAITAESINKEVNGG